MGVHAKPDWDKKWTKDYCRPELPARMLGPTWELHFHNPQCQLWQIHSGMEATIEATYSFTWIGAWGILLQINSCKINRLLQRLSLSLQKYRYHPHTTWHQKYLMLMKP